MPRYQHTVLCGLGEAGMAYIADLDRCRDLRRHGPVVVIEREAANPNVAACRALGIPVIIDDALAADGRALRRAGVPNAERVIGLLRADSAKVQFVMRVQRALFWPDNRPSEAAVQQRERQLPRVIAQASDPRLAHRLENYEKIARYTKADVRVYNIHAIQAQQRILR